MAEVPPPQFLNENNSLFSSICHELTQPQPKICHRQVCDLKTLIPHGHTTTDVDLLHTTKYGHTYERKIFI